jgi:hypothetical protein
MPQKVDPNPGPAPATRPVNSKFLPVARRVARVATVVRRGEKLGTFQDDALLGVKVDVDTRLVQGPAALPAPLRKKSYGQRMFPTLQRSKSSGSIKDFDDDDLVGGTNVDDDDDAGSVDSGRGSNGSTSGTKSGYDYMDTSKVQHTGLLQRKAVGNTEARGKAKELAAQLHLELMGEAVGGSGQASFFHKDCTREQAESLLLGAAAGHAAHANGLFLARGAKTPGAIALSVFADGAVVHYQFKQQDGAWVHNGLVFGDCGSIEELAARLREADAATALCHPLRDHIDLAGNLVCSEVESWM